MFFVLREIYRAKLPTAVANRLWHENCLYESWIRQKKTEARCVMTVLIVILMFAVFILIDHYFRTAKQPALQAAPRVPERRTTQLASPVVGGFKVPEHLRYHPGHTWALSESPTLMRV